MEAILFPRPRICSVRSVAGRVRAPRLEASIIKLLAMASTIAPQQGCSTPAISGGHQPSAPTRRYFLRWTCIREIGKAGIGEAPVRSIRLQS